MLRKDIKQVICSLVSELDFYFEERGFKRRKNGLIYVRKVGTTIQKIDMVFFSNPSYYQNVLAHIYPHMEILFPNVNSTAKIFASKLIPEKWLDKFTIRQPIQIYSNSEDFCLKDISNYECLKEEMLAFFKEYTMPLLEQLTCEKDYLALYENKDKRIIWDDNQFLYIASAYFNEHRLKEATQVIEKRFGKPGLRKRYKQVFDIENELVKNVTSLLMELGTGFAFMGQQYHLEVGGKDFYIDLLFYNTKLRCYVAIDLKTGEFKPEQAGKMNFYLSALDDLVKAPEDNPSVGLILCRDENRTIAEYALRDMSKPIGVSEYHLCTDLPLNLKNALPAVEDIRSRIDMKK